MDRFCDFYVRVAFGSLIVCLFVYFTCYNIPSSFQTCRWIWIVFSVNYFVILSMQEGLLKVIGL